MHIVLVMDQYDRQNNGTTVTARRLAESLRAAGHTVTVLAGGTPEEGKLCASKHRIPFFQKLIESQGMCFAKPDPALYYQAFKQADIVHFFMPFRFCRKGEEYARQMGVPRIAAFHVQPENITSTLFLNRREWINERLYRAFRERFYNRFTHIHCPSNFIAQQLKIHGYTARTHVISNGVAQTFRKISVEKPPEWKDKFVILMVGRYSREKRQDILIRAVHKSKYADRIQLVLAGKGPTRGHYERMGRILPHPPIMQFYTQEELLRVMNQSDLYVHPSDVEIEGISAMEAMACGLVPVISDSVLSATHQYALCEESLFAAGDADDLADKIDYWIEHPQEKAAYAQQYIAQQEGNRVEACTQKMLDVYRMVIEEEKSSIRSPPHTSRSKDVGSERMIEHLQEACQTAQPVSDRLATAVSYILEPVNRGILGLRITGQRYLEQIKGAVIVCNHIHHLDCTMVKSALRGRKIWILSLKENFEIPVIGHLVKALGAVPIYSNMHQRAEVKKMLIERIWQGDMVLVFAEGMLLPYARGLRPLWGGAFELAVQADCPVIPAALALRPGTGLHSLKQKPCFTLHFLPPIYPDTSLPPRRARMALQQETQARMISVIGTADDRSEEALYQYESQ